MRTYLMKLVDGTTESVAARGMKVTEHGVLFEGRKGEVTEWSTVAFVPLGALLILTVEPQF